MPRLRHLLSTLLVLCTVLFAARARAQSVSISNKASLVRRGPDGTAVNKRQINPEAVSYADCFANQNIEVTYVAAGFNANQTLEVWAGATDCKPIAARSGTTQQCWRPTGNLPLQSTGTVTIPVRNILGRRTDTQVADYSANTDVCKDISLTTYGLYFLWFQGTATEPIGTGDQVDVIVKTIGPSPLSGLKVLPGNARVIVTFNAAGEGGVADQQGVRVYCDDKPSTKTPDTRNVTVCPDSGSADASTASDASDDSSVSSVDAGCTTTTETVPGTGGACSSSNLVPAKAADGGALSSLPDAKYLCAELGGNTGSRVVVESFQGAPFVNDKTYAVAVAAIDSFGNVGTLTDVTCATPGATSDFWQLYRDSGGQAGGCSTEATGAPGGGVLLAIPMVALLGSLVRRRVRGRKGESR